MYKGIGRTVMDGKAAFDRCRPRIHQRSRDSSENRQGHRRGDVMRKDRSIRDWHSEVENFWYHLALLALVVGAFVSHKWIFAMMRAMGFAILLVLLTGCAVQHPAGTPFDVPRLATIASAKVREDRAGVLVKYLLPPNDLAQAEVDINLGVGLTGWAVPWADLEIVGSSEKPRYGVFMGDPDKETRRTWPASLEGLNPSNRYRMVIFLKATNEAKNKDEIFRMVEERDHERLPMRVTIWTQK
jgi:hypothetical protein